MASIAEIVDVSLTVSDSTVAQAGFGVPLIASYHTRWTNELVREYSSLAAMVADGFTSSDMAYKAAAAVFGQNPRPEKLKIGRRTTSAGSQTVNIVPVVKGTSYVHKLTITKQDGTTATVSFTEGGAETVTTISQALDAAIDASGLTGITPTGSASGCSCVCSSWFSFTALSDSLKLEESTSDSSIGTNLDAILAEDNDWYCLLLAEGGPATINGAGSWVQSQSPRKILIADTHDHRGFTSNDTNSNNPFYTAKNNTRDRVAILFCQDFLDRASAAWAGRMLPTTPGAATWAHKTLAGVSVDTLSDSAKSGLESFNGNWYRSIGGRSITFGGTMATGRFIDEIIMLDWLEARLEEEVVGVLFANDKVPFTDAGGDLLRAAIDKVLRQGISNGGIAADPAFAIVVPLVANVPSNDKTARKYSGITFTATLAGAVHTAKTINGTIKIA